MFPSTIMLCSVSTSNRTHFACTCHKPRHMWAINISTRCGLSPHIHHVDVVCRFISPKTQTKALLADEQQHYILFRKVCARENVHCRILTQLCKPSPTMKISPPNNMLSCRMRMVLTVASSISLTCARIYWARIFAAECCLLTGNLCNICAWVPFANARVRFHATAVCNVSRGISVCNYNLLATCDDIVPPGNGHTCEHICSWRGAIFAVLYVGCWVIT